MFKSKAQKLNDKLKGIVDPDFVKKMDEIIKHNIIITNNEKQTNKKDNNKELAPLKINNMKRSSHRVNASYDSRDSIITSSLGKSNNYHNFFSKFGNFRKKMANQNNGNIFKSADIFNIDSEEAYMPLITPQNKNQSKFVTEDQDCNQTPGTKPPATPNAYKQKAHIGNFTNKGSKESRLLVNNGKRNILRGSFNNNSDLFRESL